MLTARIIISVLISLVWSVCAFALDVKLQWEPNTESDIAGYKVYYGVNDLSNPIQLDVSNQTLATTISGLDPALNYSFAIAAYNTSGLEAPYSNIVKALESVVPTVSITSPVNNAQVINTVSISANASDNVGVTKVEYYVDGILKSTDTSVPYQYAWDAFSMAAGTHNITVKAYDAAGNIGDSSISVSVVKDVTPPTITSTAPASGSTVNGIVSVSCTASDNVGVTMVEFYVNGVIRAAVNSTPYSYNWDTKAVSDGSYILTAKAYDAAGNSAASELTVTVNNPASLRKYKKGDLNGDGKIDIADVLLALKQSVGLTPKTVNSQVVAATTDNDFDGDVAPLDGSGAPHGNGVVDIADAFLIMKNAIGMVSW